MNNPFKNIGDTFEAIATMAGDINGELDGFLSKSEEMIKEAEAKSRDNAEKFRAGQLIENMEGFFEYAVDFCNEKRVELSKIITTSSLTKNNVGESFKDIILSYSNLPSNYKIDESLVDLTPEATGVHFAEYMYDPHTDKFEAKLDEDPAHYSVAGIVNAFIPQICDYSSNGFAIVEEITSNVLNYLITRIKELQTILLDGRDMTKSTDEIVCRTKVCIQNIHGVLTNIRKVYQIAMNMNKNLDIIESAYTIYFNSANRVMTL